MKQIILFCLLLLPFCLSAQILETFDGPDYNSANPWRSDSVGFYLQAGQLCFDASGRTKGVHYIKLDIPYANNMEWEFDVSFQYVPTAANHARAYVYATGMPDNQLFYIQIGRKDKSIQLIRLDRDDIETILIKGRSNLFSTINTTVRVRLQLKNESEWILYSRTMSESNYTKEGENNSTLKDIRAKGVFNFSCHYEAKSLKDRITRFDNVRIDSKINALPDIPETALPSLQTIDWLSAYVIQLTFDQSIDYSNAQIELSPLGNAYKITYSDLQTRNQLSVRFEDQLESGVNYTLLCSGLKSFDGRVIPKITEAFFLEPDDSNPEYQPGQLRINEVMADPTGLTDLPETEYIEIYNAGSTTVQLSNWLLCYGTSEKQMPACELPSKGYVVCYRTGRDISLQPGGIALPMDNFPASLANAGKELALYSPSGVLIDQVLYEKATPALSWERNISGSFQLCKDRNGGTPGGLNSCDKEAIPEPEDPDLEDLEIDSNDIVFNELMIDPPTGGAEYIELYNRSDKRLPLHNLSVCIRKNDGTFSTIYTLAGQRFYLEAKSYVVLTKNKAGVEDYFYVPDEFSLCEYAKLPVLANTSSTLVLLRSSDQEIIDEVSYNVNWHSYFQKQTKGVSLERIDPEKATQDASNWSSALADVGFGSPGSQNSIYQSTNNDQSTGIEPPCFLEFENYYSIRYQVDRPGYACRIFIYNTSGICVTALAEHRLIGLSGEIRWDGATSNGRALPLGIYIFYAELYHPEGDRKNVKQTFLIK